MPSRRVAVVVSLLLLAWTTSCHAADAPVSLELATESGFPIDGHRRWMTFLENFEFTRVQIRGGHAGDEPKIESRGTDESPRYRVIGILTKNNRLELPGLSLRPGDRKKLTAWLDRLRSGGEEAVTSPIGAFGLLPKQVVAVVEAVKPMVVVSTKDKPTGDVVRQIARAISIPVEIDSGAQRALATNDRVLDELKGLSRGTALAAAVRPLGLVVVPTGQGRRSVGLRITKAGNTKEVWPVGLKPRKPPVQLAPALFRFINVEINDRPLTEALQAIQGRLRIPILFDHNSLAKHEVDLNAKVSFPSKNTFYKKIIDQLLFQLLLRSEIRVDDGDRPFLWVTSVKK